MAANNNWK